MKYWLMKSEPDSFSIDALAKAKNQTSSWDGVRNYQARNFMRDKMQVGDLAYFYHSSCKNPGVVGTVAIASKPYPDLTQFDKKSKYYDPKSTVDNPRWYMVDVKLVEIFSGIISLKEIKANEGLADMVILQPGNRLSITPITNGQWQVIENLKKL